MKLRNISKAIFLFAITIIFNVFAVGNASSGTLQYSIKDCGPATDPFKLNSLTITPTPISIPGIITVSVNATLARNVTSPLTVSLKITKKVGPFEIEVPCVDNFGSCTYNDICKFLPPDPNQCPTILKNLSLPCNCPFASGIYDIQNLQLSIKPKIEIPKGQYDVTAQVSDKSGLVACYLINADYH